MKILILNWRDLKHPRAGGAEVRLFEVYSRLVKRGHHVRLHCSGFEGGKSFEKVQGLEVLRHGGDSVFQLQSMWKLSSWIKDYEPDIVVEDFNKLPFLSPILHSKPKLIQVHHLWKKSIFKEGNFFVSLMVYLMEKSLSLFYKNQKFCSVSESTTLELSDFGIDKSWVTTIYNGFQWDWFAQNQDSFQSQDNLHKPQVKPYFLWLGRLQKYKGIDDAVEAFQVFAEENSELDLYIAGSGPDSSRIKAKVKNSSISKRVHFLGFVDDVTKFQWLAGAEAFLQTSYKEGWGLTVIEANSVGTPVIANRAPGLVDSVQDQETGLLYEFANHKDLALKMKQLVEDEILQERLSKQSLEWAKKFTWDKCSEETEVLLKGIIE